MKPRPRRAGMIDFLVSAHTFAAMTLTCRTSVAGDVDIKELSRQQGVHGMMPKLVLLNRALGKKPV